MRFGRTFGAIRKSRIILNQLSCNAQGQHYSPVHEVSITSLTELIWKACATVHRKRREEEDRGWGVCQIRIQKDNNPLEPIFRTLKHAFIELYKLSDTEI